MLLRYLPYLLVFGLWIYAFVDCLVTPEHEVRGMPKVVWVLVILLFGTILLGPLAWLLIGKRRGPVRRLRAARGGAAPAEWHRGRRLDDGGAPARRYAAHGEPLGRPEPAPWIPPDDNPEFLRALSEQLKGGGPVGGEAPEPE